MRSLFNTYRLLIVGICIAVIMAILPFIGLDSFFARIISFGLINIIVVMGLVVLYGYSDQISLASAAFYGIGAYSMAYVTTQLGLPSLVGIVVAVLLSATLGLLVALPALRLKSHYLAMGTMAFTLLASWFFAEAIPLTGGVDGRVSGSLLPVGVPYWASYLLVLAITIVVILFVYNLTQGAPGLAMRALGANDPGARASGIKVEQIKVRAHIFAAVCAGLAGALFASVVGYISPSLFGLSASSLFLAMIIVGGKNSLTGPIIATVALSFIQYLALLIPDASESTRSLLQSVQTDFYAVAVILLILFAPKGLGALRLHLKTQKGSESDRGERPS